MASGRRAAASGIIRRCGICWCVPDRLPRHRRGAECARHTNSAWRPAARNQGAKSHYTDGRIASLQSTQVRHRVACQAIQEPDIQHSWPPPARAHANRSPGGPNLPKAEAVSGALPTEAGGIRTFWSIRARGSGPSFRGGSPLRLGTPSTATTVSSFVARASITETASKGELRLRDALFGRTRGSRTSPRMALGRIGLTASRYQMKSHGLS